MDLKNFAATIQYESSLITECTFENNVVDLGKDAELITDMEVAVSTPVLDKEAHKKYGRVRLTLDGHYSVPENSKANCKYHVVLIGKFSADEKMPESDFVSMLWGNGSTALYSIARGKMEVISSTIMDNGKIVLPMVNMIEYLKAKSEENQD